MNLSGLLVLLFLATQTKSYRLPPVGSVTPIGLNNEFWMKPQDEGNLPNVQASFD